MSALRVAVCLALLFSLLLSFSTAQTNLITNGDFESGLSGWMTPLGVNDTAYGITNALRAFTYSTYQGGSPTPSPNGWAYSGQYSALWESTTLNQSLVQSVAVTGGAQYLLSFYVLFNDGDTTFYLQVSAQFNDGSSPVLLLTPSGQGAQQSFCSGSAAAQPPFYWSQFKFTVTAPSSASAMNLTFYGYDSEYGFLVDAITMYSASGNSQPSAPPSLPVVPSNNLLLNGDFEAGTVAPWRESGGDNPYGASGSVYSGEGAYDFNGFSPRSGIPCPGGNYCFTFGAPLFGLPITQTISVPSGSTSNYTLSFQWYSPGGYNASNPSDGGSALVVSAGWNSGSSNGQQSVLFQTYNTSSAAGTASSPNTVTASLGVPPSGSSSVTLQMAGYFYATEYVVDNIVLTATGVTAAQSPVVYTCASVSNPSGSNGAAPSFTGAAVLAVALASVAALSLLL